MKLDSQKILLTGGAGFLGSYVYKELILAGASKNNIIIPRTKTYDLRNPDTCKELVKDVDLVIHLAANVGGIGYNQAHPGALFYDNAIMSINLLHESYIAGVKKFVGVGTVCAYPKFTPVPFKETDLWIGYPEETNAPYGLAKKMLLVQSQAYRQEYGFNAIHLLSVNLYGPGDNFSNESSHVIPALIKKFITATENNFESVSIWGTGQASREFLYVSDAAMGIVKATLNYSEPEPVNLGSGMEITIKDLVEKISNLVGFKGTIIFDPSKPDGQPRRCLDTSRAKIKFDFEATTPFDIGLKKTISWYKENRS